MPVRSNVEWMNEVERPVCDLIRLGVEPVQAAIAREVPESKFEDWMQKGRVGGAGNVRYSAFRKAVLKAEAECEAMLVTQLRSGKNWQAAAHMLERRFPERWLRRSVNGERVDRPDGRPAGGADPFASLDNVVDIQRREKR